MAKRTPAPKTGAIVIPFPRYAQPAHRRLPSPGFANSPEYEAGFAFALSLVKAFRQRGYSYP